MLLRENGLNFRSANPTFLNTKLIQRLANPFLFKRLPNFSLTGTGSLIPFMNMAPDINLGSYSRKALGLNVHYNSIKFKLKPWLSPFLNTSPVS